MVIRQSWVDEYKRELQHANSARMQGNEGMARVCARRAARIIIGEYLTRRGYTNLSSSIFDRISIFTSLPEVSEQSREVARLFLLRVTPEHSLPNDTDLLRATERLVQTLSLDGET